MRNDLQLALHVERPKLKKVVRGSFNEKAFYEMICIQVTTYCHTKYT